MKYLSVCSGIEAATVAWHHLGWTPAAFSEIEPFPAAVLQHHYPNVVNHGDMTKFMEWLNESINLLVGGTPCQSFSVAGLRQGLKDPRGNLMLTYLAIAERYRPRWLVWENVPGVLSSNRGRDFGTFLGALVKLGYGFAYRVLDAQWFGVAQRRRRVFVVGYLANAECAAKVLFESESVCRNTAPSREKREGVAATITSGFGSRGVDADQIANGNYAIPQTCGSLCADTHPGSYSGQDAYTGRLIPQVHGPAHPIGFGSQMSEPKVDIDLMQTLQATNPMAVAQPVSYAVRRLTPSDEKAGTLRANPSSCFRSDGTPAEGVAIDHMRVRRLTPVECERLQGFPDRYTEIPWRKKPASDCPDGPRYKALGNSMAVPVMRWIGERVAKVEAELSAARAKS